MAHVERQSWQLRLDVRVFLIPAQQRLNRESVTLIPPAELEALFRHPDYSGNGRVMRVYPGESRDRGRMMTE